MCLPCTCVFCPAVYNLLFVSLFNINIHHSPPSLFTSSVSIHLLPIYTASVSLFFSHWSLSSVYPSVYLSINLSLSLKVVLSEACSVPRAQVVLSCRTSLEAEMERGRGSSGWARPQLGCGPAGVWLMVGAWLRRRVGGVLCGALRECGHLGCNQGGDPAAGRGSDRGLALAAERAVLQED